MLSKAQNVQVSDTTGDAKRDEAGTIIISLVINIFVAHVIKGTAVACVC